MVFTGKPLLILKIISAVCLICLGIFYLPGGMFFFASVVKLNFALALMAVPLIVSGTCFLVVSYRQFSKARPWLLSLASVSGLIAHIIMIWFIPNASQDFVAEDTYQSADPLLTPDHIEIGSFQSIDPSLIWIGLINIALLIIPFIVNFRKQPPIAPVFD